MKSLHEVSGAHEVNILLGAVVNTEWLLLQVFPSRKELFSKSFLE